jgi:hypothetical protein
LGRRKGQCKGPEAGTVPGIFENSKGMKIGGEISAHWQVEGRWECGVFISIVEHFIKTLSETLFIHVRVC